MSDEKLSQRPRYRCMESRIPVRDALSAFVPDAPEPDPVIAAMQSRAGQSRWYPVEGGHQVLMPFDGGPYDTNRFSIESGSWDHEHCDVCGAQPYCLLCSGCYETHVVPKQRKPWWRVW